MSNLRPFIKCTSPVAIHRGSSVFLYPCRHCECCQVSRQKSLSTMLALEESNAKYCYFVNPTYDDANVPAVRVPMDADFGSFASLRYLHLVLRLISILSLIVSIMMQMLKSL